MDHLGLIAGIIIVMFALAVNLFDQSEFQLFSLIFLQILCRLNSGYLRI